MTLNKWWALQHVRGGDWFPQRVLTLFGIPLATQMYRARGPYPSHTAAEMGCDRLNGKNSVWSAEKERSAPPAS
jgi:hypothetical protein